MFIVARRGLKLRKSFYFWAFLFLFGPLGLTMHVRYDPTPRKLKNSN
jgi:hypothetical protein